MNDNDAKMVKQYYHGAAEREWERLDTCPLKFELTVPCIMQKSCNVILVDLSDGNIELARQKAGEQGVGVDARVCNCLALNSFALAKRYMSCPSF